MLLKKIKLGLVIACLGSIGISANAQKIVLVDMKQVMETQSDYKTAQANLDKVSEEWRQQINQEYDKIKSMYNKYQAEQVMLTEDMRKQKEEEIMNKEKEVRELQKRKFGPEGDLFLKRQELVKPIQDRVSGEIEKLAAEKGYDLIIDKDSATGIIFASAALDKTEEFLKRIKK
ncbi:MAG: OmpH family outer membrane protein [Saprospiraceae bacterium]